MLDIIKKYATHTLDKNTEKNQSEADEWDSDPEHQLYSLINRGEIDIMDVPFDIRTASRTAYLATRARGVRLKDKFLLEKLALVIKNDLETAEKNVLKEEENLKKQRSHIRWLWHYLPTKEIADLNEKDRLSTMLNKE